MRDFTITFANFPLASPMQRYQAPDVAEDDFFFYFKIFEVSFFFGSPLLFITILTSRITSVLTLFFTKFTYFTTMCPAAKKMCC